MWPASYSRRNRSMKAPRHQRIWRMHVSFGILHATFVNCPITDLSRTTMYIPYLCNIKLYVKYLSYTHDMRCAICATVVKSWWWPICQCWMELIADTCWCWIIAIIVRECKNIQPYLLNLFLLKWQWRRNIDIADCLHCLMMDIVILFIRILICAWAINHMEVLCEDTPRLFHHFLLSFMIPVVVTPTTHMKDAVAKSLPTTYLCPIHITLWLLQPTSMQY